MNSPQYFTFDWKKLASVDLNKIRSQPNHPAIQDNLQNILNCNIYKEFDVSSVDPNLLKLFEMTQMATRSQIDCQEYLSGVVVALGDKLKILESNFGKNEGKLSDTLKQCEKLRRECSMRKGLLASQQTMITTGRGGPSSCPFCEKNFIAQNFLLTHIQKRHPDQHVNFDTLNRQEPLHKDQMELTINNEIAALKKQLTDYEQKIENLRIQEIENKKAAHQKDMAQIREMFYNFEARIDEKIKDQNDTTVFTVLDALRNDLMANINQIKENQATFSKDVQKKRLPKLVKEDDNSELIQSLEEKHKNEIDRMKKKHEEYSKLQKITHENKIEFLTTEHDEKLSQADHKIKQLSLRISQLEEKLGQKESKAKKIEEPIVKKEKALFLPPKVNKTFSEQRELFEQNLVKILEESNIPKWSKGIEEHLSKSVIDRQSEIFKKKFNTIKKYLEYRKIATDNMNERLKSKTKDLNQESTVYFSPKTLTETNRGNIVTVEDQKTKNLNKESPVDFSPRTSTESNKGNIVTVEDQKTKNLNKESPVDFPIKTLTEENRGNITTVEPQKTKNLNQESAVDSSIKKLTEANKGNIVTVDNQKTKNLNQESPIDFPIKKLTETNRKPMGIAEKQKMKSLYLNQESSIDFSNINLPDEENRKSTGTVEKTKKKNFGPVVSELLQRQKEITSRKAKPTEEKSSDFEPMSEILENELHIIRNPTRQQANLNKTEEDDDETSQWSDIEELY